MPLPKAVQALLDQPQPIFNLLTQVGSQVHRRYFGRLGAEAFVNKGAYAEDWVSICDQEAEERLRTGLCDHLLPDALWLGEESTSSHEAAYALMAQAETADQPLWICDPLDGTKLFKSGNDSFNIQLALCWRGQVLAGFLHYPILGDTLYAISSQGSGYLAPNGQHHRLVVPAMTDSPDIADAFYAVGWRWHEQTHTPARLPNASAGFCSCSTSRLMFDLGPPSVSLAGQPAYDFWLYNDRQYKLPPWDIVPNIFIWQQAGGIALAFPGQGYRILDPYHYDFYLLGRGPIAKAHAALDLLRSLERGSD